MHRLYGARIRCVHGAQSARTVTDMRNCFIGHCLCTQLLYHSFTEGGVSLTTNQFEAHLTPGFPSPLNIVSRWADNVLSRPLQGDPRSPGQRTADAPTAISFLPSGVTEGFVTRALLSRSHATTPRRHLTFHRSCFSSFQLDSCFFHGEGRGLFLRPASAHDSKGLQLVPRVCSGREVSTLMEYKSSSERVVCHRRKHNPSGRIAMGDH